MQRFNDNEISYLRSQMLGRLATANAAGQPHVTPVGFRYNATAGTIDVGGYDLEATRKARDLGQNSKVSFVVDDLASVKPWRPRGVTIRGYAEFVEIEPADYSPFGDTWIRIFPERVISWGLESYEAAIRK